jgi:two-component system, chemotaxis family, CheB/CheR fusion protein
VTSRQQRRSLEEAIVDTVREPLIVLDDALRVVAASRSFYRAFVTTPPETEGRPLYELGNDQWDIQPFGSC